MKRPGNRRKGFIATLGAMLLAASLSITALADEDFSGTITVKNVVAGYEYKVYKVLECGVLGGGDTPYIAEEEWKGFLETNENAIAILTPTEYDNPMTNESMEAYIVNMESDKAARKAFAADVLQYAQENGIEATESRTAQDGEGEMVFSDLVLGIYVVDTAGRARVVVMLDIGWESEITESYKPEAEAGEASTEHTDAGTEAPAASTEPTEENSGESAEESTPQAAATEIPEESSAAENEADAEKESEEDSEPESVQEPVESSAAAEVSKEGSSAPVIIIVAVVAVLAVAAGILFVKKKK